MSFIQEKEDLIQKQKAFSKLENLKKKVTVADYDMELDAYREQKYKNEAYNNLMENTANYDWLMESKAQLENGKISYHELIEVEEEYCDK